MRFLADAVALIRAVPLLEFLGLVRGAGDKAHTRVNEPTNSRAWTRPGRKDRAPGTPKIYIMVSRATCHSLAVYEKSGHSRESQRAHTHRRTHGDERAEAETEGKSARDPAQYSQIKESRSPRAGVREKFFFPLFLCAGTGYRAS